MAMKRLGAGAALLLAGVASMAAAQQATPVPAPAPRLAPALVADDEMPLIPLVPLQSTAAPLAPLAAGPVDSEARPAPQYLPDAGGPLSGAPREPAANLAELPAMPVRTLAEAVTLAYRTNPQLLAQRATARSADYRVPQARSAYGPTLNISGAYNYTNTRQEIREGTFARANGWTTTASMILNQPVFTFGRNAAAEAGALATSEYQRDLIRVTEAEVLNNVVGAYVSVVRDAAAVTIARQNLALLERQLADNQTRYEARDVTATDLDQTRTRVEFGRAQLVEAQGRLGESQKQFLRYVGAPPGDLAAPDLLDIRFGSLAAAYSYSEINSGLVRAAQDREKISRAAVAAAKAEFLPRVDLRGTAERGTVSPYSDQLSTRQLVGQVVVTQPLIDSGLRLSRAGEAREANQADWRLIDQALRETRSAVGSAWESLAASRTSLASYQQAIAAAERAYQGAVLQQRAGDRSTLDVLDLARDLLTVRTSYNDALANEYLARSALLQAAGLLEGPLLLPDLSGYDADGDARRIRHSTDIPLLTAGLSALDGLPNADNKRDRPSRDAGAQQAIDAAVPLPPAIVAPPVNAAP